MRIKKQLSDKLTLYFTDNFPYLSKNKVDKKYEVFLGIGGNIGDMFKKYDLLLKKMKLDMKISLKETSPLLKNPPFGYLEQDYFLNGIIKITTDMPPLYLLKRMQGYENIFQRKRTFKDAPRTLDIDIIFIRKNGIGLKLNKRELVVPHYGWKDRESVIIPLEYINREKIAKVRKNVRK
ncbi:MAG: 2-amino-4-hydroxy-6-hydroxymethyldihydropteridine diphosphokinase [Epsilonproteobacteria bacterium]|nr:2-amino-4-hydroxy-6-hydroxymethyldihydropteridine diphosphokinase [Campylobacterota bacterium]